VGAAKEHFRVHPPQGECTLVVGGAPSQPTTQPTEAELLRRLEQHMEAGASASDAARELAEQTGTSRRELYALLHRRTTN
jgi:16S rRNA (cytidine1402-2'-O)-methyltransferase